MAQSVTAPTTTASQVDDRPKTPPVAADGPPADVELIRNQLREKEQLVAALTARLEAAAEQLDRFRRTGVDKGHRPLAGGFPHELIEDHQKTLEDLKRVIAGWEELEAARTLKHIEALVVEVRDQISGAGIASGTHTTVRAPAPSASGTASAPSGSATPKPGTGPVSAAKPLANTWWEKQKAAMLGETSAAEPESASAPAAASSAHEPDAAESPRPAVDVSDLEFPDLPAAIDLESLSLEEARAAIRERDRVIGQLWEPLLALKAAGSLPSNLASLENLPAPLQARIAEIEAQWQAKFRQAELDLSVERARLAREQSTLRSQQEALAKRTKHGADVAAAIAESDGNDGTKRGRWFRFMGKDREEPGDGAPGKDA